MCNNENMNLFQKNLELWTHIHPREAIMLQFLDSSELKLCQTKQGEINIRKDRRYYHSNTNAAKEAEKWFSILNLADVDVLYVYGVGLGYYYDAAKDWLKKNKKHNLVFLEDDLAVIHKLFETEKATEILKNPQVHLYSFKNLEETEMIFIEMYWNFHMKQLVVSALNHYAKTRPELFSELHHKISHDTAERNKNLNEYLQYGVAFFKNYYHNMLNLPGAYLGNGLFGKFKNIPAIICGAGPSLEKNISTLKSLQNNALIFAGSSAINALYSAGIQPHFGAGIDPNPAQLDRIRETPDFKAPFFYRNRFYPPALQAIKGSHLYITGSGGYDIHGWFEKKLNIENDTIEEGHNVVNFCLEIANAMGCNPIIFVGMDLAYTDMNLYAPGVLPKSDVTKEEILITDDYDNKALLKHDINGKPIYTLWKWISEAQWIGNFTKNNPDVTVINATEGGLGFPDVPNQTLKSVAKKYFSKNYNLNSRIKKQIDQNQLKQITSKKITAITKELQSGLENCVEYLNILIDENERVTKKIKAEKTLEITQSGLAALAETELAEEPAYYSVLDIFNTIYTRVLNRDILKLASIKNKTKQTLERLKLNSKKFHFLRSVATANVELIKLALKEKKK